MSKRFVQYQHKKCGNATGVEGKRAQHDMSKVRYWYLDISTVRYLKISTVRYSIYRYIESSIYREFDVSKYRLSGYLDNVRYLDISKARYIEISTTSISRQCSISRYIESSIFTWIDYLDISIMFDISIYQKFDIYIYRKIRYDSPHYAVVMISTGIDESLVVPCKRGFLIVIRLQT